MTEGTQYSEVSITIKDEEGRITKINLPKTKDLTWSYKVAPDTGHIERPIGSVPEMLDLNLSIRAIFDEAKNHHYTLTKNHPDGSPIFDPMTTNKAED